MKIQLVTAKEIVPLFRAAVRSQIESWHFESQIEETLGVYFRNMELAIQDLAAAGDPETIDEQDVQALIECLKVES